MRHLSMTRVLLAGGLIAAFCLLDGCSKSRGRSGLKGTLLVFSASQLTVDEDGGSLDVAVRRIGAGKGDVGVDFATADGTATAGSDYDSTSGTLAWPDGDVMDRTFSVQIHSDLLAEGDETIALSLSNPTGGATLGSPAVAEVIILDVQPPGSIQLGSASHDAGEVSGTATIRVTRTGGGGGAVSVDYSSAPGTAAAGIDYVDASGTLTWADGDTSDKTFSITIVDDALAEGSETIDLTLANVTGGATLGVPTTAVLTIIDNDGPPGWTSSGDGQVNAYYGWLVAAAGDVNDDGFGDVIIGASRFDATNLDAGKAYVHLGGAAGLSASPSWESSGDDQQNAAFGGSAASAGDVDGDGIDDVVAGAWWFDTANVDAGKAYVFLGGTGGLSVAPAWESSGHDQAQATFGSSVASAGDVNGDGYDDLIVGSSGFDTTHANAGRVYVYPGGPTGLSTAPSWESSGDNQAIAAFGVSAASAGDVNGDGYDDIVVGASAFDTSNGDAGKAYVYLGGPGGLSMTPSWESSGDDQTDAYYGSCVAPAGDVDGDGYDDIIVGARGFDTTNVDAGKAYIYPGGPGGISVTPSWESSGEDQANSHFGASAASAGDVNGDGYADVIAGAWDFDTTVSSAGRAYVYFGGPGGPSLTPTWHNSGDNVAGALFGVSVASAGDVDGDGLDDLIIGARNHGVPSTGAGKAYVYADSP